MTATTATSHLFANLQSLPLQDQFKLSRFGQGAQVEVPHATIHEAFERWADSQPSAIAGRAGEQTISYRDLDLAANQLANHMVNLGIQPRQRVCLVVQRSIEMLVGILAVLKAGCQYVPIDGAISSEQALEHVISDTAASLVLCLARFEEKVRRNASNRTLIIVLGLGAEGFCSMLRPGIAVASSDGAYAIYTSGSTGAPKGVDVTHRGVTSALLLEPAKLGVRPGSKVAQVMNIAFDMGAWEILGCLMNGGTLCIRGSDWTSTLGEVDILIATPSILAKFRKQDFANIRTIVSGGEPCPQHLADEWAKASEFLNICGPTEITILNTVHKHSPGAPLSIGRPIPNTTVYILDEYENPVPVGTKGIMWVGGAGVSRGYINLPGLTAARYKADKFIQNGRNMFNTGDLVSWNPDGTLQTFGRFDHQVKVKGFRVELDGISAVAEKFPGIDRVSVILQNGALQSFYTAIAAIDEQALRCFVSKHLPYYSVPERWSRIEEMPLTPNGKVDKAMLSKSAACISTVACFPSVLALDKGLIMTTTQEVSVELEPHLLPVSASFEVSNTSTALPPKNGYHWQRWLRHRLFILYRRFFTFIILANIAAALTITYRRLHTGAALLQDLATATASNLTMAILMRSEPVINFLFTLFCSVPTSWPLFIRRRCTRILHIGGIHSGAAIAALIWLTIFTVIATRNFAKPKRTASVSGAALVLTYLINILLMTICALSHPTFRRRWHNSWEASHRYFGWTALILIWIQATLFAIQLRPTRVSKSHAVVTTPSIWLLTIATSAIIYPWLYLRKRAVRAEVLSSHAVRLHFDYTSPVAGTGVRLAKEPLRDWHGFATIPNRNGEGYSLVVSNAGDFTKDLIQNPPSYIWTRGIPACGVLRIATLFKSIVLVATGSGIGPCLAVILAKKVPCRILWTAPQPEKTFGKEIVSNVFEADPDAIIHDTRTMGKPDMALLAWKLYSESAAEAVCVISNRRFTQKIVYAMESRGIPAYGAIFDS